MDAKDRPLPDFCLFRWIFFLLHNYEPMTKLQPKTQAIIVGRAQTCPCNESLHILWRKCKVLHHHLSYTDVDVCLSD